jgi:pyruvate/2-oxoglutarate dehydrogenase complex dihydrolipoamide dehydrogenase (E3) component
LAAAAGAAGWARAWRWSNGAGWAAIVWNVGCVPSKCVIRSSRLVGELSAAAGSSARRAADVDWR